MAKMTEEQLIEVDKAFTVTSEQYDSSMPEAYAEYDCLIDSMNPKERAAIIDKYYDF